MTLSGNLLKPFMRIQYSHAISKESYRLHYKNYRLNFSQLGNGGHIPVCLLPLPIQ